MIISHNPPYIFLANGKCASMSIAYFLKQHYNGKVIDGHHGTNIPNQYQHYFTFGVVRNPYSRHVSLYKQICRNPGNRYHDPVAEMSFAVFVDFWEKATRDTVTPDEMIQSDFLFGIDRSRDVHILRFEHLSRDFSALWFLRESKQLPHKNRSEFYDWREYYTPAIRDRVYDWYADDFINFNYPKDIPWQKMP